MNNPNIFIIGSGPSGLIAANYLKSLDIKFNIVTTDKDGFADHIAEDFNFKLGQRTMFFDYGLYNFYKNIDMLDDCRVNDVTIDLTDKIGVYFKGKIHNYPIQNNTSTLSLSDKLSFYWSYFNRPRLKRKDYAHWVRSVYGKWMSDNILLPHTWKTLKEDLWEINSDSYGKKVIPLKLFAKKKMYAFSESIGILDKLRDNVKEHIIVGNVKQICLKTKELFIETDSIEATGFKKYDYSFNTIDAIKLIDLLPLNDTIEVAKKSLQWNNMFLSVFILPSNLINTDKKILYFPERKYLFSKINIDRKNGYTVVTCESSFRRNDNDKFECQVYREKYMNKIEYDLKDSGIVSKHLMTTYHKDHRIISPAYIITDSDYKVSNDFIQSHCEHYGIYNIGRFSEWKPNLRLEHSFKRIEDLVTKLKLIG